METRIILASESIFGNLLLSAWCLTVMYVKQFFRVRGEDKISSPKHPLHTLELWVSLSSILLFYKFKFFIFTRLYKLIPMNWKSYFTLFIDSESAVKAISKKFLIWGEPQWFLPLRRRLQQIEPALNCRFAPTENKNTQHPRIVAFLIICTASETHWMLLYVAIALNHRSNTW